MPFHRIAYSCADWDGLRDHLRDVPWQDIFKLNEGKSTIPPLFNGLEVLSSPSDKAKLFAKNFS